MSEISEKCQIQFTAEHCDAPSSPSTECPDTMSAELEAECEKNRQRYADLIHAVAVSIWRRTPPKPGMYDALPAGERAAYEELAADLISLIQYESCDHDFEGLKTPSTPDGPGEWHEVCRHCGGEKRGDD